jgi:hypothetical protein
MRMFRAAKSNAGYSSHAFAAEGQPEDLARPVLRVPTEVAHLVKVEWPKPTLVQRDPLRRRNLEHGDRRRSDPAHDATGTQAVWSMAGSVVTNPP